jgi:hypothetical protein
MIARVGFSFNKSGSRQKGLEKRGGERRWGKAVWWRGRREREEWKTSLLRQLKAEMKFAGNEQRIGLVLTQLPCIELRIFANIVAVWVVNSQPLCVSIEKILQVHLREGLQRPELCLLHTVCPLLLLLLLLKCYCPFYL